MKIKILLPTLLSCILLVGCSNDNQEVVNNSSIVNTDENTVVERVAKFDYLDKTDLEFYGHLYDDETIGVSSYLKNANEDAKIIIDTHPEYKDSEKFKNQVVLAMQACGGTEEDAKELFEKIDYYLSADFIKSKESKEYVNGDGDFFEGIDVNDNLTIWLKIFKLAEPENDLCGIEIMFLPKKDHSEYISSSKLDFDTYLYESECFRISVDPYYPEIQIGVLEENIENVDFKKELELVIGSLGGNTDNMDEVMSVLKNLKEANEYVDVFIGEKYKMVIGLFGAPLSQGGKGSITIGIYENK